jgi:hypothetical protein
MKRRTSELRRKTPLAKVNRRRRDEAWVKAFGSPERVKFVAALPCLVCGVLPSENHHVRSRGAGGSYHDVVPLCRRCHDRFHTIGSLALLQAARKARWFAPLLVWDASMMNGDAGAALHLKNRGMWREAESWEGAAEIVDQIWEARGSA